MKASARRQDPKTTRRSVIVSGGTAKLGSMFSVNPSGSIAFPNT